MNMCGKQVEERRIGDAQIISRKKLIDVGLAGSSMDMEIRFWTVSPTGVGLRTLDVVANPGQSTGDKNISIWSVHKSSTALFCADGFYGVSSKFSA